MSTKSYFLKNRTFSWKKVIEKKMTFFDFVDIFHFPFFSKIKFSPKKWKKNQIFSLFNFLSCIMPKPYKWRRATPPVPPVGAANASSKIRKIMFFDDFWWFFDDFPTKNDTNDLLVRAHLALRSGFGARPTSNGPSSELKWSYEDFPSMWISN